MDQPIGDGVASHDHNDGDADPAIPARTIVASPTNASDPASCITLLGIMRIPILILVGSLSLAVPVHGQLSDSEQKWFVALLYDSMPLPDVVSKIREGKVPDSSILAIVTILSNSYEVETHRMRGASENKVYVSKDGKKEAVYDANGNLVKDGINDGSYNYFHAQRDPLRHLTFDIAPWLLLGQSRNDPTTREERVHEHAADIFAGLARARENYGKAVNPTAIDLKQPGTAEAIALFLVAIENGGADELLEAVDPSRQVTDERLIGMVRQFEDGLRTLMSPKTNN